MNAAHLHLVVNTAPILGAFTAAVVLTIALFVRERGTWVRAGVLALAAAVVATAAAYLSGMGAVDVIRGMPRTSGAALEQHHMRATVASALVAVAAFAGAIAFVIARHRGRFGRRSVSIVLASAIAAFAALAWTGLAGGHVNHPELQDTADRVGGPVTGH